MEQKKTNGVVCFAKKDEEFYIRIYENNEGKWTKVKWTGETRLKEGCCNTIYTLYLVDKDEYRNVSAEELAFFDRKENFFYNNSTTTTRICINCMYEE